MYWTIWSALVLFAAGEMGRRHRATWAWWSWLTGVVLLAVHIAIAMATVHGWSHASAIAATARATNAVFGVDWGGGVYANYLFLIVWAADTALWHARRPRAITWTLRIFYLVMILNAAVIFAAGSRRFLGAAIVGTLLWSWRPLSLRPEA
jgi:hypothetical protein